MNKFILKIKKTNQEFDVSQLEVAVFDYEPGKEHNVLLIPIFLLGFI